MKLCQKCNEKHETGKNYPECGAKVRENTAKNGNSSKAHEYLQIGLNGDIGEKAFSYCKKALEIDSKENVLSKEEKRKLYSKIAFYYESGLAGKEAPEKAFEFYNKASELGNSSAKVSLALCYRNGDGTVKNEEKAFENFEAAAKLGHRTGYYFLGHCYLAGCGTVENPEKAFECFKSAAELGENYAYYWLGLCYENGFGCAENPEKAFESFKKTFDNADAPDADLKFELGYCYIRGYGCDEDIEKGFGLVKEAAEEGCEEAQKIQMMIKKKKHKENTL